MAREERKLDPIELTISESTLILTALNVVEERTRRSKATLPDRKLQTLNLASSIRHKIIEADISLRSLTPKGENDEQ
jgi:hypothetical protein